MFCCALWGRRWPFTAEDLVTDTKAAIEYVLREEVGSKSRPVIHRTRLDPLSDHPLISSTFAGCSPAQSPCTWAQHGWRRVGLPGCSLSGHAAGIGSVLPLPVSRLSRLHGAARHLYGSGPGRHHGLLYSRAEEKEKASMRKTRDLTLRLDHIFSHSLLAFSDTSPRVSVLPCFLPVRSGTWAAIPSVAPSLVACWV